MGKYKVTDNVTGQSFVLEGDSPPTEQELTGFFASRQPVVHIVNRLQPNLGNIQAVEGIAGMVRPAERTDPRATAASTLTATLPGTEALPMGFQKAVAEQITPLNAIF